MALDIKALLGKIPLPFFKSKEEASDAIGLVGIRFAADKVLVAYIIGDTRSDLQLVMLDERPATTWEERTKALREIVEEYNLIDQKANVVVTPKEYRLTMVEKPDEDIEDLEFELGVLIQDYINYKVESAIIDYFSLPFSRSSDNKDVLFVASIKLQLMQDIEACLKAAKLRIESIDIPEFCYRNLQILDKNTVKGYMIVNLGLQGATLYTYNNENLIMSRRVEFDLSKFAKGQEVSVVEGTDDSVLDEFTLQLQRSIDYCNSVFRQAPIGKLIFYSADVQADKVYAYLGHQLGLPASEFELHKVIELSEDIQKKNYQQYYAAIGAALKNIDFNSKVDKSEKPKPKEQPPIDADASTVALQEDAAEKVDPEINDEAELDSEQLEKEEQSTVTELDSPDLSKPSDETTAVPDTFTKEENSETDSDDLATSSSTPEQDLSPANSDTKTESTLELNQEETIPPISEDEKTSATEQNSTVEQQINPVVDVDVEAEQKIATKQEPITEETSESEASDLGLETVPDSVIQDPAADTTTQSEESIEATQEPEQPNIDDVLQPQTPDTVESTSYVTPQQQLEPNTNTDSDEEPKIKLRFKPEDDSESESKPKPDPNSKDNATD